MQRLLNGWQALWRLLPVFWMISSGLLALLSSAWTLSPSLPLPPHAGEKKPQHLTTGKTVSTGQTAKRLLRLVPLKTALWSTPEQLQRDTVTATSSHSFLTKHSCQIDIQQSQRTVPRSKTHLKVTDTLLLPPSLLKFTILSRATASSLSANWVTLQLALPSGPTTLTWCIIPHLTCLKERQHLPFLLSRALGTGPSLLWDCTNVWWSFA